MGIGYFIRNRGLRFGDENDVLFSYNHLYNYLTRTESLRFRLKRYRLSCTARERLFKIIIILFITEICCCESKRYRPNLLPIIYIYRANWEYLGEKEVITRTRESVY